MKKILIFSDSHGDNQQMKKIISNEQPNLVVHAGDYCCDFNDISSFVDYFCAGNNDYSNSDGVNGKDVVKFEYEGLKFLVTHSHKQGGFFFNSKTVKQNLLKNFYNDKINVFIYGHSHQEDVDDFGNCFFINPGSISLPRNQQRIPSYAKLLVEDGKILSKLPKDIIEYNYEDH